jgi:hypothetical protein
LTEQEAQLPPAQPAQPPPVTGALLPSAPTLTAAKTERARLAVCPQSGQAASWLALMGWSFSNLFRQVGQTYSYIGIARLSS